jgi:predicted secreted hydrolase
MSKTIIMGITPEHLAHEGLSATTIEPWEDGLRAPTGPGYFEWWYFDAHLDDGSTAVITYLTKPFLARKGGLSPVVGITITPPDGRRLSILKPYSPAQFSAEKELCSVRIGPNSAGYCGPVAPRPGERDHERLDRPWIYEISAETDGLAAHLVFTGVVPPWRPGASVDYFTPDLSRYFAWLPSIPFGSVRGELTYDGRTHRVTGTGYHDHNWGNVGLDAVMSHWVWGRAHVGDYSLIYVEMISNKAYGSIRLPVFFLARGDRILTGNGFPLRLETADVVSHPGGRSYPQKLDFSWQADEGSVRLALRNPKLIEATSLLEMLPKWKRRLARLAANPYYFRFNAELELTVDLEKHEMVCGSSIYEIMLLR